MIAAIDGDLSFTFRDLDERVNRLVTALRGRGVGPGDRILWLGQNSFKVLELMLAAAKLGSLLCPANWRMSVVEVRETIADFDPRVIFWQELETGETHRTSRMGWEEGRLWIQHDGTENDCFSQLIEQGSDEDEEFDVDADEPMLAFYTAGFTGEPNAALITHTGLLLQAMLSSRGQAIDEDSRYLVSGPMFHLGVLMGALATFCSGGACVFVSRPDPEEMVRLISSVKVTHAFVPQPLVARMAEAVRVGGYDVSTLFTKPDLSDWDHPLVMPSYAPQRRKRGAFGQTEMSGNVIMAWMGGSAAGRPNPFCQVKILDPAGREVPAGETGEIAVRGPMVMTCYFKRPELNAQRSRDGWHRTNDLGKRLDDGSIVFLGPKSVMIKTGIENVYPVEVEACLRRHDSVAEVCVIGVPDPIWDQNVKAVVVLKQGYATTVEEMIDFCRNNIASYKKPKLIEFALEIPKINGIVDRVAVDKAHGGGGYPRIVG